MRIYFVGSHATGKTTLCRYVSRRYGLPMISEVARAVLAEMETGLDALRTDMDLVAEYQERVFARQVAVEKHARGQVRVGPRVRQPRLRRRAHDERRGDDERPALPRLHEVGARGHRVLPAAAPVAAQGGRRARRRVVGLGAAHRRHGEADARAAPDQLPAARERLDAGARARRRVRARRAAACRRPTAVTKRTRTQTIPPVSASAIKPGVENWPYALVENTDVEA